MKFYLTKAAQRAAESGQAPVTKEKVAKAPRVVAEKAPRVAAEKAPSARQLRAASKKSAPQTGAAAASSVAPVGSAPSAPVPTAPPVAGPPAPSSPSGVPSAAASAIPAASFAAVPAAPAPAASAPALPDAPAVPVRGSKFSKAEGPAKEKKGIITIGGQPRVDLLPLEVRTERKAARNVRRAWLGVAAVVVVVAIGVAGATVYAHSANSSLVTAQAATTRLNLQAQKYSKAQTVQDQVDLVDAALKVGGSTDIDWPSYLSAVALTVPSGATLSGVTVDSASTVQAYAQASSPLEGQRVATLTLTATSSSLPSVPTWLQNLTKIKGYEDATAGTVALSEGVYTSTVTLHINKKAFSGAYTKGN